MNLNRKKKVVSTYLCVSSCNSKKEPADCNVVATKYHKAA